MTIRANKLGIEATDFDTPNKTMMNRHSGFAGFSLAQHSANQHKKNPCGKCGKIGTKLYAGGVGRSVSLCADCLLPTAAELANVNDQVTSKPAPAAPGKIIKLVHCYFCEKPRPSSSMSRVPVICIQCLVNDGSRPAMLRIEKGLLRINRAVRRAACI